MRDNPVPPGYGPGPQAPGPQAPVRQPGPDPQRLFTPGPRLGWVFRDRRELAAPYQEPQPNPQLIQTHADQRTQAAEAASQRAWRWVGKPSIILAVILVLLSACSRAMSGSNFSLADTVITIVVLCGPGLGYTGWKWYQRDQARDVPPEQEYQQAVSEWDGRAARHENNELARLASQPEWGSVTIPARRTDVFGGTLAGWQALIAVHGASLLAQRPLLIADLTGQYPAGLLMSLCEQAQVSAVTYRLPGDLGKSGLLNDLSPGQLADAIAEALHAGTPGGARTERAIDVRVLNQLAGVLSANGVTAQRLAAAVGAALGQSPSGYSPAANLLSAGERDFISGEAFAPGYREGIAASLIRLDAVLAELAASAGAGWPAKPAQCTCLAMDAGPRSASGDVLTALVAQWLTVQAAAADAGLPAVIVAGADEITRAHAERLADACELRGAPLTLLFRHLRDDAAALLGGGTAAFMRLGNHHEAEQAAGYLGRQHTYVMSSRTATRGGARTDTSGSSEGHGTGDNSARAKNAQGGGLLGFGDSSHGKSRTSGTSTSANWGTSTSQAEGNNWTDAATRQRVYEYQVEPATLQNLPDCALLLADRSGRAMRLRAVECDPSIMTLPEASTGPLRHPGSVQYDEPAAVANTAGNTAGNAAGNTIGNAADQDGQAITPPAQRPDGWAPAQPPPAAEPAWLPDAEVRDIPWWQRNQPPEQRP